MLQLTWIILAIAAVNAGKIPQTDAASTVPTTTTTTTTRTTTAPHTTIDSVIGTTAEPSPPASCEGLKNGTHALGACSQKYFSCWYGKMLSLRCLEGLAFSETYGGCVFKWRIPECNETFVPIARPLPNSPPVVDFCNGKTNGWYGDGCNPYFYICDGPINEWNKFTTVLYCPDALFYDAEIEHCQFKETIVACGAKPKKTTTTITTGVTNPSSSDNNKCQEKPNGFFGTACNNYFYYCSDGSTFRLPCPRGHHFDDDKKRCTKKEMIATCGATTTTTATDTAAPATVATANPASAQKVTFNCTGKADGFYVISGCSKFYARCFSNTVSVQQCPAHLAFNHKKQLCDYKEKIPACPEATVHFA